VTNYATNSVFPPKAMSETGVVNQEIELLYFSAAAIVTGRQKVKYIGVIKLQSHCGSHTDFAFTGKERITELAPAQNINFLFTTELIFPLLSAESAAN